MLRVGIVGWRGMVGSVLVQRMREERDFDHIQPVFFSTSRVGSEGPPIGKAVAAVADAMDVEALKKFRVVVSCQGSDYTNDMQPRLRRAGWDGYWIDAASALRMRDDAVIILDPVNLPVIKEAMTRGIRNYIGGNCTVSLMLMGMAGLFRNDLVEWMTTMTYQAASGAGAAHLRELAEQIACVGDAAKPALQNGGATALDVERRVSDALRDGALPKEQFGYPLAASLLPWIDQDLGNGQSREEWKGQAETNKILGRGERPVPIDGVCVRVGAMRCHSQALTIKLRKKIPVAEVAGMIAEGNEWVRVVPNRRAETLAELTPAAVTGKLSVPVGRIRALPMGPDYVTAFTVGDQLLWGAAEPLRRMLRLLLDAGVRD